MLAGSGTARRRRRGCRPDRRRESAAGMPNWLCQMRKSIRRRCRRRRRRPRACRSAPCRRDSVCQIPKSEIVDDAAAVEVAADGERSKGANEVRVERVSAKPKKQSVPPMQPGRLTSSKSPIRSVAELMMAN